MRCPYCAESESRVVDSRLVSDGSVTWRRRECDQCKRRFTTYERLEVVLPMVKKKDGKREPFERGKLLKSLRVACSKRPVSEDALIAEAETLEREFAASGEREVESSAIGARVMARLRELDEVAYVRFASVYRSFRDVGEFMQEMGKLVRDDRTE